MNTTVPTTTTDSAMTLHAPVETTGPEAPTVSENTAKTYGGGKFASVEELEQAYAALQQKTASSSNEQDTAQASAEDVAADDPSSAQVPAQESREEADKTLSSKGLNLATYEQEWAETGELSEQSYASLEKAGIPKTMVDSYIAGQTALRSAFEAEVKQLAGGDEGYAAVAEWAATHMTPQEAKAYNDIVMYSQDREAVKLAVTGLVSRYREAEGQAPALVGGKAGAGGGARDVFESTAQVIEAMRDKRYGKDPAYTKGVEARMSRSKVFG